MPVLTINGRPVTVDDSFLSLPREEQDATVEEIASSMPKAEPSGTARGLVHGISEAVHGNAETLKQYAGVGDGLPVKDEGYVPANLTNGSLNPLKWNWSQAPQKIAEGAPGLAQDALAATAAKAVLGKKLGPLAPVAGAALSAILRTAGDDAKSAAVNRTGNPDAEPETQDKVRGGLTSAGSAAVGALAPTRFVPGSGRITEVGAQGALDAAKRYLATTAIAGGSSAASDAVNQVGLNGSYDPAQGVEAAGGGLVTGGALAAPRGISDTARSASLREFGGANREALSNYATRLQTEGDGKLGSTLNGAANDAAAHERVVSDLQREFKDASSSVRAERPVSQDAENAMAAAARGERLTPKDVDLIEKASAGTTDGDNAAYLARTLRVAQMAQSRGSYSKGQWAGGISGALDDNLGYMLNPTRIAGGAIASLAGMHLLGLSNPLFAGSVAAGYGMARIVDGVTGSRSPAKMFADHFADAQANLRKPPAPPVAPPPSPPLPGGPAMGPWGPKPQAPTSVPQVATPQAPAPTPPPVPGTQPWSPPTVTPLPQFSPVAMQMLNAKLKAGLPPEPAPSASPAPPITPGAQPWAKTSVTELPQFNPLALKMLAQNLKQGLPKDEPQVAPAPVAPTPVPAPDAPAPSTAVPKDVLASTKALMSGMAKVAKIKAASEAPSKITKSNGKVKAEAAFEPKADEHLYPEGITPEQYAAAEADAYLGPGVPRGRRENYMAEAEATARNRIDAVDGLKAAHPDYKVALNSMLRQLHKVGGNHAKASAVVHHYAGLLPDNVGKAVIAAFQ